MEGWKDFSRGSRAGKRGSILKSLGNTLVEEGECIGYHVTHPGVRVSTSSVMVLGVRKASFFPEMMLNSSVYCQYIRHLIPQG